MRKIIGTILVLLDPLSFNKAKCIVELRQENARLRSHLRLLDSILAPKIPKESLIYSNKRALDYLKRVKEDYQKN